MKNNLKFSIKKTPERDELIKQMADPNRQVALAAQESFAKFVTPAVQTSINQKLVSNSIYTPIRFSKNERPTIPLDLFVNTKENQVSVWSQQVPGGLATNFIQGLGEYTFQVYRLDSAISMENDMAKYANLSIISLAMDRMANTIGIQQERNSWSPILSSLGTASTNGLSHVINSKIAGVFLPSDLSALATRIDRIWTAYTLGTPDLSVGSGLTDMYVSPEIVGQIREFAYNPANTRGGYKSDGTESVQNSVPLPDAVRESIWQNGGLTEMYGVQFHKMLEFGKNAKYNVVFDNGYAGSFDPTTQEILVGLDLSRDVFLRPIVTDDDNGGGDLVVKVDDQFTARSERFGFYAKQISGAVLVDDRAVNGIIV